MKLRDRSLAIVFLVCFSAMLGSFPGFVSPRQTWAASERELMIEGAKKEGKVTWYTTLVVDVNETIRKAFDYYKVEELKEQHAPVDWVPFNPVIAYLYAGSLSTNAPHPHGARLLLDFLLSREGQAVLARSGVIPARTDVPPKFLRLVKGIKFWPSDISIAVDYNKYLNQFREIFLKGAK